MKKQTKKIYCIHLDADMGELWLDEDKKPLRWVHCNDAHFRSEYQEFIIDYLGGELIEIFSGDILSKDEDDELFEVDCMEAAYDLFSDKLDKIN